MQLLNKMQIHCCNGYLHTNHTIVVLAAFTKREFAPYFTLSGFCYAKLTISGITSIYYLISDWTECTISHMKPQLHPFSEGEESRIAEAFRNALRRRPRIPAATRRRRDTIHTLCDTTLHLVWITKRFFVACFLMLHQQELKLVNVMPK